MLKLDAHVHLRRARSLGCSHVHSLTCSHISVDRARLTLVAEEELGSLPSVRSKDEDASGGRSEGKEIHRADGARLIELYAVYLDLRFCRREQKAEAARNQSLFPNLADAKSTY